ncbi:hypothetical protein FJZ20_00055 [Candidatus Pacearchaeota archaeon]|nr:hypothetical protein [Candidatus Pacearchaeota archaeon]
MKTIKYPVLLALAVLSLISSILLSLPSSSSGECLLGGTSCNIVHSSEYNYFLGIQNSYYGIVIFSILSLLIYLQIKKPEKIKKNLIHLAIIFGSLFALYFLYLQHFVLNAYCDYCLIVDFSMLISLGIIIANWKK